MNIDEVTKLIGKGNIKKFDKFMYGQTVGYKDGIVDYYEYDVNRFMRLLK